MIPMLRGFARVDLQPGERRAVEIGLDLSQLRWRDRGAWRWEDRPVTIEAARWAGDPLAVRWHGELRPVAT